MIYLNNAATSFFKPDSVKEAILGYLSSPGNPERGVNSASLNAGNAVFSAREKIANFFNFKSAERVIWTSGITESLNTVINGILKENDHVITTYLEHNSVLRPLYRKKVEISITSGSLEEIKKFYKSNTRAVIINHVSNVTGEIQDIESVGKWCRENGVLFIVDTAQSAGVIDIDVQTCWIDLLCFTGHKGLLGPQGIGGIIINTDEYIEPLKIGGTGIKSFSKIQPCEYPNHLEAGTLNVPGILALSASIDYINSKGVENIRKHECKLSSVLLQYLRTRKDIELYENKDKDRLAVVSFNIKNRDCAFVSDYLSTYYDIAVRTGALCAPLAMEHYGISSCIRVSFGLNNTEKDVEILIKALEEIR